MLLILAVTTGLLGGCRSRPQVLPSRDAATLSAPSGAVALELVPDPGSPAVELGPGEEYVPPGLDPENRSPVYPSELVPLRLAPHSVVVRVTFDEQGRVLSVDPSPVGENTAGSHRPAFTAAVEEAVKGWRCRPAMIRKFRPGPDGDGDGKPDFQILSGLRVLKAFFDAAFTFEISHGLPVVKRGPASR